MEAPSRVGSRGRKDVERLGSEVQAATRQEASDSHDGLECLWFYFFILVF